MNVLLPVELDALYFCYLRYSLSTFRNRNSYLIEVSVSVSGCFAFFCPLKMFGIHLEVPRDSLLSPLSPARSLFTSNCSFVCTCLLAIPASLSWVCKKPCSESNMIIVVRRKTSELEAPLHISITFIDAFPFPFGDG